MGPGAPRVAYRVLDDDPADSGRADRHPRGRARPDLSSPRERDRPERSVLRMLALRSLLGACRVAEHRRREDVALTQQLSDHPGVAAAIRTRGAPPVSDLHSLSRPNGLRRGEHRGGGEVPWAAAFRTAGA